MNRLPLVFAFLLLATATGYTGEAVGRWDVFEISLPGPDEGNAFVEVEFAAVFEQGGKSVRVPGFYDGGGIYRVRFMPDATGVWSYQTHANRPALDGRRGSLTVTPPAAGNHGPVVVSHGTHFAHADGTPYWQVGTTCYAWTHQPPELEEETLRTLATAPFNKLRMCVFPKWFDFNHVEPQLYPFAGTPPDRWDFQRFNPAFFQHLERRILDLQKLGIEADVILFHPYDGGHWGFDRMGPENDARYLRYIVARLAAYRNVWWSLANEWDYVKTKQPEDWERFGQIVRQSDPFGHLCSIHQQKKIFDPSRPWITHLSLQSDRPEDSSKHVARTQKPVIYDECKYEGNIPNGWGRITAERMTELFWRTLVGGAYCGHGETYLDPHEVLWWAKGGVLHGRSPERIAFYKGIAEAAPTAAGPLAPENTWGVEGRYYLIYHWEAVTAPEIVMLPQNAAFIAEIIDTWNMTITPVPGVFSGRAEIPLPKKPYLALRLTRQ